MSSKRQQTMAKLARERLVKERRALKLEKKQAAREAKAGNGIPPPATFSDVDDVDAPEANASPDPDDVREP